VAGVAYYQSLLMSLDPANVVIGLLCGAASAATYALGARRGKRIAREDIIAEVISGGKLNDHEINYNV